MKNPFYKVPSYVNEKKIAPEKYLDEIKGFFKKEFIGKLNGITNVLEDVNEFKKENKLDGKTKGKYVQELNDQFKGDLTQLEVFKLKNDLALKLGDQLLYSKRANSVNEKLDWLTEKGTGIDDLMKTLNNYVTAFDRVEKKYTEGDLDKSFKASFNDLKIMIPDSLIEKDVRKIKIDNLRVFYGNMKNSYYGILDKTDSPVFKKSIGDQYPNLPISIDKGTNDPAFNDAYKNDVTLEELYPEIKFKILGNQTSNRKISTNKNGEEKKLKFDEEVRIGVIPRIGKIDIYVENPSDGELSSTEKKALEKAKKYQGISNELGSYEEVAHDFTKERNEGDNNSLDNFETKDGGLMELSGQELTSLFSKPLTSKPLASRHVTVHLNRKKTADSEREARGMKR